MGMMVVIFALSTLALGYLYHTSLKKIGPVTADLAKAKSELEKYSPIKNIQSEIDVLKKALDTIKLDLKSSTELLNEYELKIDIHEMGYYHPKFEFEDVIQYAEALELVREAQKEMLREKEVIKSLNGQEPSKKAKDIAKLAVNAFNGETNLIMESVRFDNFEKSKEQMRVAYNKINTMIEDMGLIISEKYLELRVKEMAVAYDYREAEQKSKEEQLELKESMKEEERARVEAEKAREKAIEEQERYEAALDQARKEMATKSDDEKAKYEAKILEMQKKLEEATAERERATSMAQITKKGYVYIISNIGSFGENVLKIGMTRRNDPNDRIKELGDASVPFGFDIHAMIQTEDAPGLENMLHQHFDKKRMNKVNNKKEFFRVNVEEITQACDKLGHKVKLSKLAEAREFRQTVELESKNKAA